MSDYRDLFSEYPVPPVSADRLDAAISLAYSAAASQFTPDELHSLRPQSEIRAFILQSYCIVCGQIRRMDISPENQLDGPEL